jgi:hypothetical protein
MDMTKPVEKGVARQLRAEHGWPIKQIAKMLDIAPATASVWVRDIEITPEQRERNVARAGRARGDNWRAINRARRDAYQREGRERARQVDELHLAGCMLYWGEGAKERNIVKFANSDPGMVRFFVRFLKECFEVPPRDLRVRLNVYTNNGLGIEEIEDFWLATLELPRSCLRGHSLNSYPTSSSGKKRSLPYGTCFVTVAKSTHILQHIYGAIQEYGDFEEPRWLDGPPRKSRPRRRRKDVTGDGPEKAG